jgi:hypothetical protein
MFESMHFFSCSALFFFWLKRNLFVEISMLYVCACRVCVWAANVLIFNVRNQNDNF